ncbi:MAG: hypothetical protein IPO33_02790 [Saprospiraceae bacterium]|nr:hypothetical protein [Candidatus Brachybacter algidus]
MVLVSVVLYTMVILSPDEAADNFKLVRPALGVFASHHFNDRVAFQLGIQNFTLAGDDKINSKENLKYRNLSFRSNVWEIALKGNFIYCLLIQNGWNFLLAYT